MSIPGAAKRHPEPDDPAAVITRTCAEIKAEISHLRAIADKVEAGEACPQAAPWLRDGGHRLWDIHQVLAGAVANFPAAEQLIEMGRQLERDEQAARSRPRHARPSRSHLRLAGVAAAAAVMATTGGTVATMSDTGNAHRAFLPSPAAVLHAAALPSDTATLIPQAAPSSSSLRPSVAARTAAPVASPSPSSPVTSPAVQPSPAPTQEAPPALQVSVRDLELTGTTGTFTLAATTEQGVSWSIDASAIPGASVDVTQGVLTSAQQPVTVTLTDPLGEPGVIYVKWDGGGVSTIWVTSAQP